MAALANEGANLVWERVQIALMNASEAAQLQFKQLRMYLATQQKNPSLQFLSFSDSNLTTGNGAQLGTGTPLVYAVYMKKNGSTGSNPTSTACYLKVCDDATDGSTTATHRIAIPYLAKNEEKIWMDLSIGTTTTRWSNGVAVVGTTTCNGIGGATTSSAGDTGSGFVIVG